MAVIRHPQPVRGRDRQFRRCHRPRHASFSGLPRLVGGEPQDTLSHQSGYAMFCNRRNIRCETIHQLHAESQGGGGLSPARRHPEIPGRGARGGQPLAWGLFRLRQPGQCRTRAARRAACLVAMPAAGPVPCDRAPSGFRTGRRLPLLRDRNHPRPTRPVPRTPAPDRACPAHAACVTWGGDAASATR